MSFSLRYCAINNTYSKKDPSSHSINHRHTLSELVDIGYKNHLFH